MPDVNQGTAPDWTRYAEGAIVETYPDATLLAGARTPFTDLNGALAPVSPTDLGIHAASSHPFTVASLPGDCSVSEKGDDGRVIEMYARVRGGITARLENVAGSLKRSRVLLDGPYGGFEGNLEVFDRVLLLAGGSGPSSSPPFTVLRSHRNT